MSEDILDQIDNALADVTVCFCGCKTALRATSPSPWFASEECQARWAARLNRGQDGSGKEAERVTAAAVEALGEYMERVLAADVATGPSAGGVPALVDIRRQVQDGTAPAPGVDPVHDACRAEVARQGLHEYWLDGVRYVVRGRTEPDGPLHPWGPGGVRRIGHTWALTAGTEAYWPEPVAPPVDAALEPLGRALSAAEAHGLVEIELVEPARGALPWWRRLLPRGKR